MNPDKTLSRREMVAVGTGLVATPMLTAIGAGAVAPGSAQPNATDRLAMQNPLTEYPKPPFKRQHQESPGLASLMDPRPDHGETSYKGSGKLVGRKALITGGDSGMGRAAAIAFAREGADVAFGYLPVEEPDAQEVIQLIRAEGRKAIPLPGDIRDESFCQKMIADAVSGLGGSTSSSAMPPNRSIRSRWATSPPSSLTQRFAPMSTRCSGSLKRRFRI